jgi:hypothetical protein
VRNRLAGSLTQRRNFLFNNFAINHFFEPAATWLWPKKSCTFSTAATLVWRQLWTAMDRGVSIFS